MEYRIKRQIPHLCIMFWTFSESSEITWFSFKAPNSKKLTLADHFPFAQHLPEHLHVIIKDQVVLSKNGCHGTSLAVQWLILACTSGHSLFRYFEAKREGFWALPCQHVNWVQLHSYFNSLWHCLSFGLEWKLTFSSPVAIAEFSKFAGILRAAL